MTDAPGPLLASGRAADVYDLGNGRVLRRYRTPGHDLEHEARVMRHVAQQGFSVPAVHSVDGDDMVMDKIDGRTMLEAITASPWTLVWSARTLARLQQRLARIEAPNWMFADPSASGTRQSIVHLDLHPMNVMLSSAGPVVIDWTNASAAPAGFDGAITYVEVATVSVDSTADRIGRRVFAEAFRSFRGRQLIEGYLGAACDHRLADAGLFPDERTAVAELRRKIAGRRGR